MDRHSKDDYQNDTLARKVVGFLLIFQGSALLIGLIFTFIGLSTLALLLAFVTLVILLGALLWAYIRFQTFPIVQEKKELNKKANDLQGKIVTHQRFVEHTQQEHVELQHHKQNELQEALRTVQNQFFQNGLMAAKISDADIPGVGEKLKQRLAASGYTSAVHINQHVTAVEGLGPAKTQAVLDWRRRVYGDLDRAKPKSLPPEQEEQIQQKYKTLFASNREKERQYKDDKANLEQNLGAIQPHIQELAPVKFGSYLRKALGNRGIAAGWIAAGLIFMHVCLGTSSTMGVIVASIPTATLTPTVTFTPTRTFTPTVTDTPTSTHTPTITDTPTVTLTPSWTSTPTKTPTPTPTQTLTRTITRTPLPYIPPVVLVTPGPIGNCDPSYPTVCIPPPPPDLDCKDIPYRNFQVLPPDPHHFDGNHDGVGCES